MQISDYSISVLIKGTNVSWNVPLLNTSALLSTYNLY